MRELTNVEKRQLELHNTWYNKLGEAGRRLNWRDADLSQTYMRDVNLCEANLRKANLRDSDLSRSDLKWAALDGADLRGSTLNGADLSGASLKEADLSGASLTGTNLCGAKLCGANLYCADLSGANLIYAICDKAFFSHTNGYVGFENIGVDGHALRCTIHADGWHCYMEYFGGTLSEFENAMAIIHGNDIYGEQYRAIIACLKALEPMYLEELNNA